MATAPMRDPQMECMSRADTEQLQLERLQATVNRAYRNVAFYRRRFDDLRLSPEDVQGPEDLAHLPLTEKEDLRAGYPYGMFAVPLREVVRVHMSSGTTGSPSVVGYTANDVHHLADLVARNLAATGVTHDDVVQIFFGYGIFTAGFGFHYGTEALGASVIPFSHGDTQRQVQVMRDFRTTVIIGTPHYALSIAAAMGEMGVDPHELSLRVGLFGGEPWEESVRETIQQRLQIEAFDVYGLAELGGPGVSFECPQHAGLHVAEDHFYVEVIDPATGARLGPGEEGELVFTTLYREAFPLLRYRSGDISSLNPEPCACGRTHARMGRVSRYADDRAVVRGVSILPRQVQAIVGATEGLSPHFQIIVDRTTLLERLELHVQLASDLVPDSMRRLVEMEGEVKQKLEELWGLPVDVKLGAGGSIAETEPRIRVLPAESAAGERTA